MGDAMNPGVFKWKKGCPKSIGEYWRTAKLRYVMLSLWVGAAVEPFTVADIDWLCPKCWLIISQTFVD